MPSLSAWVISEAFYQPSLFLVPVQVETYLELLRTEPSEDFRLWAHDRTVDLGIYATVREDALMMFACFEQQLVAFDDRII